MKKKYWYLQEWGSYTVQTPIFVGYSIKEITKIVKKQDWKQEVVDKWVSQEEQSDEYMEGKNGAIWSFDGYSLMYLPKWENTWEDIDTLVHECFHLVIQQLGQQKGFVNSQSHIEEEGMAYQLEFLFREIRQRLNKHMVTEKKSKKD